MSRDYKNRVNANRGERDKSPCWVWFLGGLLVGLFSAGLIWLKMAPIGQSLAPPAPLETAKQSERTARSEPESTAAPAPKFDFYTLLPEMEVVIPEEELRQPPPRPTHIEKPVETARPKPSEAAERKGGYLLQMGSFRRQADAERLKVRLLLLDIAAEVQKVTINNKDTFHRVRSGPYHDSRELQEIRARLRKNDIQSIAIRAKR